MPFQPDNKLAKGHKGSRIVEEAIRRAITQDDGVRIRAGVEKLLDMFAAGDLAAFDRIADRTDGKPNQSITTELNVNRDSRELTDDELRARIDRADAILRRARALAEESGAAGLNSVH